MEFKKNRKKRPQLWPFLCISPPAQPPPEPPASSSPRSNSHSGGSFCSSGRTPAPALPPATGYCMIKPSKDSSGRLSQAQVPWMPRPPYRCCLRLASRLTGCLARCLQKRSSPQLTIAVNQHERSSATIFYPWVFSNICFLGEPPLKTCFYSETMTAGLFSCHPVDLHWWITSHN